MQLTDTHIKALKPLAKPKKYFDGGGLFLYVLPTGSKRWRMAYRFDKKENLLSFGEYPTVTLKDARMRREEAKKLLSNGINPSEHGKAIKAKRIADVENSFRNVALEWYKTRTTEFSDKHRKKIMSQMENYLFPVFGNKPVSKVEAQDILAVVRLLEKDRLEVPRRVVQVTGRILRFAVVTGRAKHNVASDLGGALRSYKVVHRASITDPKRVGQLLRDIDSFSDYFPLTCALKLAPLVFTRPSELRCATWDEFDFNKNEWRIPAHRMKMEEQHIVPLSRQALQILQELKQATNASEYLFPSVKTVDTPLEKPLSDSVMLNALRRMGYEKHEMCIHGFRSMASTLLNELGYNRDWIERQLAHGEHDQVRAAYNYADFLPERKKMMQEWADYLDELKIQTKK